MPERYAYTIQLIGGYLQWLISQDNIQDKAKGDRGIISTLKRSKEFLEEVEFNEKWVFEEIDNWISKLSKYKVGQKIIKQTAEKLSYDTGNWFTEVSSYLEKCYYWEIRPEGISDLKKLFEEETQSFFSKKNYWKKLSKVAKHDLDEACLCLAFERPTAAAFLIMRATEGVLRHLYESKTQQPLQGFINWGELTKKLQSQISPLLKDNLNHLKNNFRNPVAHPDKIYSQKEAERLLHNAINVIEQMIDES